MGRFRVWADIEAGTSEEAEGALRSTLESRKVAFGATGKTEHQGWRNYETFTVNLWLANDRKMSDATRAKVRAVETTAPRSEWADAHRGEVARVLQSWIELLMPDDLPGCAGSLLWAALSEVDWYELAEEWMRKASEVSA